jgi:uncharacterized protein (DUF58 family)
MRWFLVALLLLLAAFVLDSGLLAYAMYVLLGLLVLSRWLARSWIRNISAERFCEQKTAEIGDVVPMKLVVRNEGRIPVPWVLVEDLLARHSLDPRFPRIKIKGKRLRIFMLRAEGEVEVKYRLECLGRGFFQIGPLTVETGDLFGLHRRFRVLTEPAFLLVYPRVVPLLGYELASRRPIGDVRLTHRLYEDPTRIAGVRQYQAGDPLGRVHWKATARTGILHSKVHEPSTLAGATILLDFHSAGYPQQGEPVRSELAVTAAMALANAICTIGQQVGLATNGRDAADRIRTEGWEQDPRTRQAARAAAQQEASDRLQPLQVPTRRGVEQVQHIRELLARIELTDGLSFAALIADVLPRIPRDATLLTVLPRVTLETAITLGTLQRRGLAVTVVLILQNASNLETSFGRLLAEGVRDVRHLRNEEELPHLCLSQLERSAPYGMATVVD